jgi:phosphotransferase system IIB component
LNTMSKNNNTQLISGALFYNQIRSKIEEVLK